jgi:hypothetical protein
VPLHSRVRTPFLEYHPLLHPFAKRFIIFTMTEKSDKAYKYRQEIQQVKYPSPSSICPCLFDGCCLFLWSATSTFDPQQALDFYERAFGMSLGFRGGLAKWIWTDWTRQEHCDGLVGGAK